jgi:hypothetical protein
MKSKIFILSSCLIVFVTMLHRVLANDPSLAFEWGPKAHGVQLSLVATNGAVRGSQIDVTIVTTNGSANGIWVEGPDTSADFRLLLENDRGKSYRLIPPTPEGSAWGVTIASGTQDVRVFSVTIGKDIMPGDYTLKATRKFGANHKTYQVVSQSFKIWIK